MKWKFWRFWWAYQVKGLKKGKLKIVRDFLPCDCDQFWWICEGLRKSNKFLGEYLVNSSRKSEANWKFVQLTHTQNAIWKTEKCTKKKKIDFSFPFRHNRTTAENTCFGINNQFLSLVLTTKKFIVRWKIVSANFFPRLKKKITLVVENNLVEFQILEVSFPTLFSTFSFRLHLLFSTWNSTNDDQEHFPRQKVFNKRISCSRKISRHHSMNKTSTGFTNTRVIVRNIKDKQWKTFLQVHGTFFQSN